MSGVSSRFSSDPSTGPAAGAPSVLHRKDPDAVNGDAATFREQTEALVMRAEAMDATSGIEGALPLLPHKWAEEHGNAVNANLLRRESHEDACAWNTCVHQEPTMHRADLRPRRKETALGSRTSRAEERGTKAFK